MVTELHWANALHLQLHCILASYWSFGFFEWLISAMGSIEQLSTGFVPAEQAKNFQILSPLAIGLTVFQAYIPQVICFYWMTLPQAVQYPILYRSLSQISHPERTTSPGRTPLVHIAVVSRRPWCTDSLYHWESPNPVRTRFGFVEICYCYVPDSWNCVSFFFFFNFLDRLVLGTQQIYWWHVFKCDILYMTCDILSVENKSTAEITNAMAKQTNTNSRILVWTKQRWRSVVILRWATPATMRTLTQVSSPSLYPLLFFSNLSSLPLKFWNIGVLCSFCFLKL